MLTMQQARDMRQGISLSGDRNQCAECGLLFNSSAAFDKHRTGRVGTPERRCMDKVEMQFYGMAVNRAGFWVTSLMSDSYRDTLHVQEEQSEALSISLEASGEPSEVVGQQEGSTSP